MSFPIVIPLHHKGGDLGDDTELRFALRALHVNFRDPLHISIVGRRLPAWLRGCDLIRARGLKSSLKTASERYPSGFFWHYDDVCMLQPTTAAEMMVTPASRNWKGAQTSWAAGLVTVRNRLEAEGYQPWDYSRPHGPYFFDKSMIDECFADWPGIEGKFPGESWILSKRQWPRCHGVTKQYYGEFTGPPAAGKRFLNYNKPGNTPELRAWLEQRFPNPSPYENDRPRVMPIKRPVIAAPAVSRTVEGVGEDYKALCQWLGKEVEAGFTDVLDLGCGDLEWLMGCGPVMRGGAAYKGVDARHEVIQRVSHRYPWFEGKVENMEVCLRIDADIVIVKDALESCCNGTAGQVLQNISMGSWKRLVVTTTPGADNERRRGVRSLGPKPYDVEASGLVREAPSGRAASEFKKLAAAVPARRIARPGGGAYLIYERGGEPACGPNIPEKVEIHTIRYGVAWWLETCGGALDAWCARHGHPLKIWDEKAINPSYPTAKFCVVDMMREFIAGEAEWMMYVDADVYVNADAPAFPSVANRAGLFCRPNNPAWKVSRQFPAWCEENFGTIHPVDSWVYRNAGVWICDRDAARRMLEVAVPPFIEKVQEEFQWNWWVCVAAAKGMPYGDLPLGWNTWAHEECQAPFQHIVGGGKKRKFRSLVEKGLIYETVPASPEKPMFTPSFDFEKYRFAHDPSWMPMDEFHIHLLHTAANLELDTPVGERVAVEIGSYRGASTSALIEAVNQGVLGHLHVVEIKPTETLRRIIGMCDFPDRVTLHTCPFWETDIGAVDLVFIDGDHGWPAFADTLRALTWGAKVICMHDSQSHPVIKNTWGATLSAGFLKDLKGRSFFEDAKSRSGLKTERGFFVSAAAEVDLAPLAAMSPGF